MAKFSGNINVNSRKTYKTCRLINRMDRWNAFCALGCRATILAIIYGLIKLCKHLSAPYPNLEGVPGPTSALIITCGLTIAIMIVVLIIYICYRWDKNGPLNAMTATILTKQLNICLPKDLEKAVNNNDISGLAAILNDYRYFCKEVKRADNIDLPDKCSVHYFEDIMDALVDDTEHKAIGAYFLLSCALDKPGFNQEKNVTLKEQYYNEYMRETYPFLHTVEESLQPLIKYGMSVKIDSSAYNSAIDSKYDTVWMHWLREYKETHVKDIEKTVYTLEKRYQYSKEHLMENLEWEYENLLHPSDRLEGGNIFAEEKDDKEEVQSRPLGRPGR